MIESGSGKRVDPVITQLTLTLLEVCYRPLVPGYYMSVGAGSHSRNPIPSQVLLSCGVYKSH